jgi:hypothetical protein
MEDGAHCRVLPKNMTAETEGRLENLYTILKYVMNDDNVYIHRIISCTGSKDGK